ncbi:UNVERIFIED_CONTAM: Two-component response regulator ORR26 [Sesamum latifolium]|uniref:Two-component response regulator ORR26 n=1 Tax=Sesamum latifolium TaxID=2727402 RepID=A0AAW2XPE2_9LAMI
MKDLVAHHSFEASPISTASLPNTAHRIHVLLVEHDSKEHDKAINMLKYFSYKVTAVKLASTAVSILSKGKAKFDLVMANIDSPDLYGLQLLQDATKMDLLVILMSDEDDAIATMMALEQGALFCIKKPLTMQTVKYLWQHVLREKTGKIRKDERLREIADTNMVQNELGEDVMVSNQNHDKDVGKKHKSKKKVKTGTSQHDYATFKKKVWTEWTEELHEKFMNAVIQLGEGTNAATKPPKTRAPRTKKGNFGAMPRMSNHKSHLQENHSKNQQDSIVEGNMAGDNYYNLDQNNETFNMGQFEQAFCMDELFMDGVQTVTTPASSYQNDIAEDVFEFPNMDVVVHDFSGLIEELGMDYNTSFESVFLDQDQVPSTEE